MIPVLYEPTEMEFDTYGIGRLEDAISCTVIQERNGEYDLEMEYPVTGAHFADIAVERLILAVPEDGATPQPFEIVSISEPINGIVTILANHVSYRLREYTVMPFTAERITTALEEIKSHIVGECPFTFWSDKTTEAKMELKLPVACRSLLGGMEGSILDVYGGGEYEFDRYEVKLHDHRGKDRGVTIAYGKNITDSTRECGIDGVYTSVIPYWEGMVGEETQVDTIVIGDEVKSGHEGDYSCTKCVPLDLSTEFEEMPSKELLQTRAAKYLEDNTPWEPSVSVELSFLPLNKTLEYADIKSVEHVRLCDTVTVENLGYTVKARVIRTEYNVLREMYNTVELGDARISFAQQASKGYATKEELDNSQKSQESLAHQLVEDASDRLNELIEHSNGLYCTTQDDGMGGTIILLHDKPTLTESTNVIKLVADGIGFSSDGGKTYPYGFTVDGEFVARLLSAHGINADWITSGVLQSARQSNGQRNFYLNLETGECRVQNLLIHGSTADDIADAAAESAQKAAQSYADSAASEAQQALDKKLTQEEVFKRLTDNGRIRGLYMTNGELYINADYIKTGIINAALIQAGILQSVDEETFFLDLENGILRMKASEFTIADKTVSDIADEAAAGALSDAQDYADRAASGALSDAQAYTDSAVADAADGSLDALTQYEILKRLTNNFVDKGIYLENGNLYISFSSAKGGTLILGGPGNGRGVLQMLDANGVQKGLWNNGKLQSEGGGYIQTEGFEVSDYSPYGGSVTGSPANGCKIDLDKGCIYTPQLSIDGSNFIWRGSFTAGSRTGTIGPFSMVIGYDCVASNICSYAEGYNTQCLTSYGHAEGYGTTVSYVKMGDGLGDNRQPCHAEGANTTADGAVCHAEGENTTAKGYGAHAEGRDTSSTGISAHAEGDGCTASGNFSHAEGDGNTVDSGAVAGHAEGSGNTVSGKYAHAEGYNNTASGECSHAEGADNVADGYGSHVQGVNGYVPEPASTVVGYSNANSYLFTVGAGTESERKDGFGVTTSGDTFASGTASISTVTQYGNILEYGYNTTSPMYGDIGEGQTDSTGECCVDIDPVFAETVDMGTEYQVFLQKEGAGDLWVEVKSELYFIVKGTPNLKFSWELKAKKRGNALYRLEDIRILDPSLHEPINTAVISANIEMGAEYGKEEYRNDRYAEHIMRDIPYDERGAVLVESYYASLQSA